MAEEATAKKAATARRERIGCATTAKERISKMTPCVAGKRSSIYRGVTRHRWTGRYEAHLWDKSTWNQNQNKKGKQVYLGAYDDEEAAARAYDLAALKYWGAGTLINFPVSDYSRDLEEMQTVSKEEYLVSLRRKSSAFSRGFPKCRISSRSPQTSRLEASLGQMLDADCCDNLTFSGGANSLLKKNYSGFCFERKTDLTGYIRWWIPKRMHRSESLIKSFDENYCCSEDINHELRVLECPRKPTEPYQLPSLGLPHDSKTRASAVSASAFLAQSSAFKNFQQKIAEMHEQDGVCSKEKDDDKSIPLFPNCDGKEKGVVSLGTSDLPPQRTSHSRSPLLPMALKTDWNSVDPMPDPLFWASLVSPTSIALPATIRKTETPSYVYSCEE